jgi:hypothetical protein
MEVQIIQVNNLAIQAAAPPGFYLAEANKECVKSHDAKGFWDMFTTYAQ